MEDPKIEVKIKHSESKDAWNIIGAVPGGKYKIARVPYYQTKDKDSEPFNTRQKAEALKHAEFIRFCLNNSAQILAIRGLSR